MGADNGASENGEMFDLDALERDETAAPFRFQVGGQAFTFAHPGDVDWKFTDALEQGSPTVLCKALLGEDQYAEFAELSIPSWKLNKLIEAWGRHNGVELGESAASSGSSGNTATRSRPTSRGTTTAGSRTSRRGG